MSPQGFFADFANSHSLDTRRRTGEVSIDKFVIQPDGFENLRATIGLHGRDAHLGKDLQQALIDGLDKLALRRLRIESLGKIPVTLHVDERFEYEIRINRAGSVADQAGELVHISRFTCLEDQSNFCPRAFPNQMMVYGGDAQKARNRRPGLINSAITQN